MCSVLKPIGEFSISRQGKNGPVYRTNCKPCNSVRATEWFNENRDRAKSNQRKRNLRVLYGITPDEYASMLDAQGGVCAICGKTEPGAHGRTGKQFSLSVDHCHSTGKVRGLLCQKCNRAVGLLGDDPAILKIAIEYLERQ